MTESTTYAVGDRVRTLVDAPAATCSPAMPAGSLGTVAAVHPRGAVGVDLDADPWHLAADYAPHEIAPAPTLQEAITDVVHHHIPDASDRPLTTSRRIIADVLEVVHPFLAADRTRILAVVNEWVEEASEYGGTDHGDLVRALEAAGYTLPGTTDDEENDR